MKLSCWLTVVLCLMFALPALAGTYEDVMFTDAEEAAVLDMANKATTAQFTAMGQTATVANNVAAARPLATMTQLAAVSYVGPVALGKFKAYVPAWTGTSVPVTPPPVVTPPAATGGTYDGVVFTAAEEATALTIANTATVEQLKAGGIAATPAGVLAANRPWSGVKAVAAFSGIGTATMTALKTMTATWGGGTVPPPPPPPPAGGGTYDSVVFTAAEEAKALDICNTAGYSQISSLTSAAKTVVYERRPWVSLAAVAAAPNVGTAALTALKKLAATWTIGVSGRLDTVKMLRTNPPPLHTGVRIPRCRIVAAPISANYIVIADADAADYANPANQIRAYVPYGGEPIAESDLVHQWCLNREQVAIAATYLEFPVGSGYKNLRWVNIYATHVTLP